MGNFDFLQGKDLSMDSLTLSGLMDQLNITSTVNVENCKIAISFLNVSSLSLKNISYPMRFECLEIIDNSSRGWMSEVRYHIHDLEDGHIDFYCQQIIISVEDRKFNPNKKIHDVFRQ